MPSTPYLNLPQVTASQSQKELTINDAITALEGAITGQLVVDFTSGVTQTLSEAQFTRNFVFNAVSASAAATLKLPHNVNGSAAQRIFGVHNTSGFGLTVISDATSPGTSIVVPNGEARLLAFYAGDVFVAAQAATSASFISLSDVNPTYAGHAGYVVVVNPGATGLDYAAMLTKIQQMGDVDWTTPPTNGQVLKWDTATSKFIPGTISGGAVTFAGLSDVPASYAGAANKHVRVNGAATGLEFVTAPVEVPLPISGDIGNYLKATGTGTFTWAPGGGGGGGGSGTLVSATPTDPMWADVALLMSAEHGFADESDFHHVMVPASSVTLDRTIKKYGKASYKFTGSSGILTALDADFQINSGDFTVEAHVYLETRTDNQAIMGCWNDAGSIASDAWYLWVSGGVFALITSSGSGLTTLPSTVHPSLSQWYHVAVAGSGGVIDIYIDGVWQAQATTGVQSGGSELAIGTIGASEAYASNDFIGHMDDIRITHGARRYAANTSFTPPATAFLPGAPTYPVYVLNDLLDVDPAAPTNGQMLSYDAASRSWKPAGGTLAALTDVEATSGHAPTDGQSLVWSVADGKWKPATVTGGGGGGGGSATTPVVIRQISTGMSHGTSSTLAFASPAGAGNLLLAVYVGGQWPNTPGGGYVEMIGGPGNSSQHMGAFVATAAGGENSLAVSSSDNGQWVWYEIENVGGLQWGGTAANSGAFPVGTSQAYIPGPPVAGALTIIGCEHDNNDTLSGAATGFTQDYTGTTGGGNHVGFIGHSVVGWTGGDLTITSASASTAVQGWLHVYPVQGTALGSGGNLIKLQQLVAAGTETALTFSAIGQSYDDLVVVIAGPNPSGGSDTLSLQFNGDTGANYSYYSWNHYGASNANNTTKAIVGSSSADSIGGEITITGYSATTFNKLVAVSLPFGSSSDNFPQIGSAQWRSHAAINSLVLFWSGGGTFGAGTTVTLYGRGGTIAPSGSIAGSDRFRLPFFFVAPPASSEVIALIVADVAFTIPANFAGDQYVKVGTNPTAPFVIAVNQNGSPIGSVTISTAGAVTLATSSGLSQSVVKGDVISFVAPSTVDATVADVVAMLWGSI